MRNTSYLTVITLCVVAFPLPIDAQTDNSHHSERFACGSVFFQNVTTGREEHLATLRKTMKRDETPDRERSRVRCEIATLTELPHVALAIVESEYATYQVPEILNHLCRCKLRIGDFASAERLCLKTLTIDPNNTDAHIIAALITRRISPEIREIASSDPYAWLAMAGICGSQQDYDNCVKYISRYLELRNEGPLMQEEYPHTILGTALYKLGRRDSETVQALEKAFELSEKYRRVTPKKLAELAAFASFCYLEQENEIKSLDWAEKGYQLDRDSIDLNLALGMSIVQLPQSNKSFSPRDELALSCLKKVLAEKPDLEIAKTLATFLEFKGRVKDAILVLMPHTTQDTDLSTKLKFAGMVLKQDKIATSELEFTKNVLLENVSATEIEPNLRRSFIACLLRAEMHSEARDALRSLRESKQTSMLTEEIVYLESLIEQAAKNAASR